MPKTTPCGELQKRLKEKPPNLSALNGPTGIALSDTNKQKLNDYLEREKNPDSEQHGFRPRLSTSTNFSRVVEFIKGKETTMMNARPRSSLIFKSF
ncbi:hypothetical protein TNCV_3099191 [Trichonephila clavipes]|nr:hypothetical protein TNCV_3099191 [Trichonephila clavipes]